MEMIVAALVLGVFLLLVEKLKLSYAIKPKRALAQITVIGPTERGEETFQLVGTLFEDETVEQMDAKIKVLTEIRERRVAFCNARMMAITENPEEILEEAKKTVEAAGLKIVES
jgi:hypothetical protein